MATKIALMPNITIPRTRFKMNQNHATTFNHGRLTPIFCEPVLPGDSFSVNVSSLIRMSNPIRPIFGNIKAKLTAFFVPSRLIWPDFEKFFGDPSNHGKIQSITPVAPKSISFPYFMFLSSNLNASYTGTTPSTDIPIYRNSIGAYLGKPYIKLGEYSIYAGGNDPGYRVHKMKELGYVIIWNEYFRPSNLIEPYILDYTNGAEFAYDQNNRGVMCYDEPFNVVKGYDYFTACTLSPQFSSAVTLPLGDVAPIVINNNTTSTFGDTADFTLTLKNGQAVTPNETKQVFADTYVSGVASGHNMPLYADLSTALAANINQIREAFQLQRFYERSNYGSRFFEQLAAHYGTTSPDGRLQRPDYLGSHTFYINVNQVLSTAGAADDATSKLGQPGAVSVTGDKTHLFTGSFTEPGYLYILIDTKFERSYASGLLRDDIKQYRHEIYSPEFQHLGDMPVYEVELHVRDNNGAVNAKTVFGYQEHWSEYRYLRDRVSGELMPNNESVQSQSVWTLADTFDGQAIALDKNFLFEDRGALVNSLVSGVNGPDYIADFFFDITATREVGIHSIPGLIDHFGAL